MGIEQPLPIEAIVRLEGWVKYLDQLVANPDTPQGLMAVQAAGQPVFQNVGHGLARGADLLVLGRTRHFFYQLSVGILDSVRTNPLATMVQTYPTPWDQRFTSGLSVTWSPTDKWLVTGRFSFRTGRPYTEVSNFTIQTVQHPQPGLPGLPPQLPRLGYVPTYGPTDAARYPPFYEISLRGEYRFSVGPLKMATYLEVLNITNSMNVFSYLYSTGDPTTTPMTLPVRSEVDHLPIRPFIGIRAEY
jgi:hypothetical protein